jgi:hypothetical protein
MLLRTYLIDCIEIDRQTTTATFIDNRNSMELALATRKSAKEDRIVKMQISQYLS